MIHTNTIKAEVKKLDSDLTILEIKREVFGLIFIKVEKETRTTFKRGSIMCETDFDKADSGFVMGKLEWLGSIRK